MRPASATGLSGVLETSSEHKSKPHAVVATDARVTRTQRLGGIGAALTPASIGARMLPSSVSKDERNLCAFRLVSQQLECPQQAVTVWSKRPVPYRRKKEAQSLFADLLIWDFLASMLGTCRSLLLDLEGRANPRSLATTTRVHDVSAATRASMRSDLAGNVQKCLALLDGDGPKRPLQSIR
jgi:hypothetical protein